MNLMEQWLKVKEEVDDKKKELLAIEAELYTNYANDLDDDEGTFNFTDDNLKLKVVKKMTVKVDQKLASVYSKYFKIKYEFDKKSFYNLTEKEKSVVEDCLTTKPAKPSFKVEEVKDE